MTITTKNISERERKKMVIVGSGGCGKTSLLVMYSRGSWETRYIPTIFENHMVTLNINDRLIDLEIWDTAGQEDYDRLRPLSYSNTDIVIICFSVTSPTSLQDVQDKWAPEVKHFCPGVPIILVATKIDKREGEEEEKEKERGRRNSSICQQKIITANSPKKIIKTIEMEEGLQVAKSIGAKRYMECSAYKRKNINSIFETAMRTCLVEGKGNGGGGGWINGKRMWEWIKSINLCLK